jgi:hypothetical protein
LSDYAEEAGSYSEKRFFAFLENAQIPHITIHQDQETSSCYHKLDKIDLYSIKRPDLIAGMENLGCIAIDVKNYRKHGEFGSEYYEVKSREISELFNFGLAYNLPVWLAFDAKHTNGDCWHFYSLIKLKRSHWKGSIRHHKIYVSDCFNVIGKNSFQLLAQ